MAARSSAAASQLPVSSVFVTPLSSTNLEYVVKYSSAELLQLSNPTIVIQLELKAALGRLRLLRTACWSKKTYRRLRGRRKRCSGRQKRGKRVGLLARLRANNRPAFLSLFLANVRSLDNKMDLLRLRMSSYRDMKNCCVFLLMETWCLSWLFTYHRVLTLAKL